MTKLFVVIVLIGLYLIWAFVYHRKDKSLTLSLYLEYLLIGLLAVVLLLGLFV